MLAYFLKRTAAYFIDCLICFSAIMLIVQGVLLSTLQPFIGITDDWFHSSWNMEFYVLLTISLPIWLYFAYLDSNRAKGTFGKRLMKLTVHDEAQDRIPFRMSFIRTLLKLLPWEIAHLGAIFPTPIYFETEPDIRIVMIFGIVLFAVYVVGIFFSSTRQTPYDRILQTYVHSKSTPT